MEITRTELDALLEQQRLKYEESLRRVLRQELERGKIEWVSQAEAYRLYGRTNVERWVKNGRCPQRSYSKGKRKRIRIADLERCAENNW